MQIEKIHILGRASVSLKQLHDAITDDKLKKQIIQQAEIVLEAHDELLMLHNIGRQVLAASNASVEDFVSKET